MANLIVLFDRILKPFTFCYGIRVLAKSITEAGVLADMIASIIQCSGGRKAKILELSTRSSV